MEAKDNGSPVRSAAQTATVTVEVSRNVNSPVFLSELYQETINADAAVDSTVSNKI